jgi:hypothetical protein
MILTDNLTKPKKIRKKLNSRIYINTLIPNFKFKDKFGKIIKPIKRCITL